MSDCKCKKQVLQEDDLDQVTGGVGGDKRYITASDK